MKAASSLAINPKRLVRRTEKHLKQFTGRFAAIFGDGGPDAIHDARVSSRRLQQAFAIIFRKPRTRKERELNRMLKKIRRRLGPCRNLDVNLNLMAEALNATSNPAVREAWGQLRSEVEKQRKREIKSAREKLARYRDAEFVAWCRKCLRRRRPELESRAIGGVLRRGIEQGRQRWNETLASVKQRRDPQRLHALRIAGKRLRYRTELLADFGDTQAKAWVKELKGLQQALGDWHDRHGLLQSMAEFVGRPSFILNRPDTARSLLEAIEKERREQPRVEQFIVRAAEKIEDAIAPAKRSAAKATLGPVELSSYRPSVQRRS